MSTAATQRSKAEQFTSEQSLAYLRQHNVPSHLNNLLKRILLEKPTDPLAAMEKELRDVAAKRKQTAEGHAAVPSVSTHSNNNSSNNIKSAGEEKATATKAKSSGESPSTAAVADPSRPQQAATVAAAAPAVEPAQSPSEGKTVEVKPVVTTVVEPPVAERPVDLSANVEPDVAPQEPAAADQEQNCLSTSGGLPDSNAGITEPAGEQENILHADAPSAEDCNAAPSTTNEYSSVE